VQTIDHKRAAKEWPVCIDKAQHSGDRDSVEAWYVEYIDYSIDLLLHSIGERGLVTPTHGEGLRTRTKKSSLNAQRRSGVFVALCIDHEYAARADDQMVNICARSRHSAIVENAHARRHKSVETLTKNFFANRAYLPSAGRVGFFGDRENQSAKFGVVRSNASLARISAPFILTTGGSARDSGCEISRIAAQAIDELGS